MLKVMASLFRGASARAEDQLTNHYAVELIEQKVREAEAGFASAKRTLAGLILRSRKEADALKAIERQIDDLEKRTRKALQAEDTALAEDAAAAIAGLENERSVRAANVETLQLQVKRMQLSIEKAHRRLIDLRQGVTSAKAVHAERKAQRSLNRNLSENTSLREAEDLIARVVEQDDPLAEGEVLDDIENDLGKVTIKDRLADAGYGNSNKVNAKDVLERLRK